MINYSKQNTVCIVKISLPVSVSIDSLKALFEEELPLVREKNPYIIKGPQYDGILEFQKDEMIVGVSAEGPEEHIKSIRMDLNEALQSMAERELLQYAQSNITINLHGGAAQTADAPPVRDQKEMSEQENGAGTTKEERFARMIRGTKRNHTENADFKDAVKKHDKEI